MRGSKSESPRCAFDADTLWDDPSNAQLRQLRTNPNILFPGDLLQIPSPPAQPPAGAGLVPGSSNNFVSSAPTTTLTQTFQAADSRPCASRPYVVQELPLLTGLTTDAGGVATFDVPVTLAAATVVFADTLRPGGVDGEEHDGEARRAVAIVAPLRHDDAGIVGREGRETGEVDRTGPADRDLARHCRGRR